MLTPEQRQKLLDSGYSVSKINAYEQKKFGVPVQQKQSFAQDFAGDVKQTVSGLTTAVEGRADKFGQVLKSNQGVLSKGLQLFGQGAGVAEDVIGETAKGAIKATLPQGAEESVSSAIRGATEKVVDAKSVQNALAFYEQLKTSNPEIAANLEALGNVGMLALDLGTIGVGGRAAGIAREGGEQALRAGVKGGEFGARVGGRVAAELEGALTGTSAETLQEAFKAAKTGGAQLDAYTNALRGKITPEGIANNLRNAVDEVDKAKTAAYGKALEPIKGNVVDTKSVQPSVVKKLDEFGITVDDKGQLVFDNSKFRTVPQAQTKLQTLYNEVVKVGEYQTIGQIDTTRQALANLLLSGDDASARAANSIITEAKNLVRDVGAGASKEYDSALKQFAEDADFTSELRQSLSANDRAAIDTTYKKLATSLKTNNEQRMALIRELDEVSGGTLLATVAGQQLSEALPRGLFRQIAAGIAGVSIVTGGALAPAIIPSLILASPRVAGEVVRALGLAAGKAEIILESIGQARKVIMESLPENTQGGFIKNPFATAKKMGPVERESFVKFVDAVRGNKQIPIDVETKARELAKDLGIDADLPNNELADDLTELLDIDRERGRKTT